MRLKTLLRSLALLAILTMGTAGSKSEAQVIDEKGDELFLAHCYEKATERYLKVFHSSASNKANPPLLRRITESVLASEMKRDTAKYFADLYLSFEPEDNQAYYMAALAHYHAHNFDIALQRLDTFSLYAATEEQLLAADVLNSWIRNARRMIKDTLSNHILNLGDVINTRNNELNPYILFGDQVLVFSCDDKFDRDAIINVYNIKASERSALSWTPAKKLSNVINTPYDEYPTGETPNGFFYCSNRDRDFAIFEAQSNKNGSFTESRRYNYPIDMRGSEVAACLSPTTDTLYFSGTTKNGKLDIFYSIRTYNGEWMPARPLPGLINRSDSDENYPYLSNDGKRMYFASDREGTMGGYDIFYSDFDTKRQEWGKPVQMPYPINDTYDNMTISFSKNGRYAYVSLLRDDSYGGRDIYAILFDHVVPTSALIHYTLRMRAANKQIVNITEQPLIEIRDRSNELVALHRVNMRNYSFVVALDPGDYTLIIESQGTKRYTEDLHIPEMHYDSKPIEKKILLQSE